MNIREVTRGARPPAWSRFQSIAEFLDWLKTRPGVLGIIEYGNRTWNDQSPGGDYDLTLVVEDGLLRPGGLTFVLGGMPVDCGLCPRSDLERATPLSEFDVVLVRGRLLWDREGDLAAALDSIRVRWSDAAPAPTSQEIDWERFTQRHVFDKVRHRLQSEPTYCRFLLATNMFWLLEFYMSLHALKKADYRMALEHLRAGDPQAWSDWERFYTTHDPAEMLALAEPLADRLLAPIGGLWREDEVIFHRRLPSDELTEDDRGATLEFLFG